MEKTKSSSTLRRLWEEVTGKSWPKDPVTGRNQDVAHIKAKADGGAPNDPSNYRPQPHDEHMQEHKANGDFKRWGARSGSGRGTSPEAAPGAQPAAPAPAQPGAPEVAPAQPPTVVRGLPEGELPFEIPDIF